MIWKQDIIVGELTTKKEVQNPRVQNIIRFFYCHNIIIRANRTMFIKNAVVTAGKMLVGQKNFTQMANELLVQLVFITTIKNYLIKATAAEENFFFVPQDVRKKAQKRKFILVLDMDETLVYTRRPTRPGHSNFMTTTVNNLSLTLQCDNEIMYVQPRPFANDFLLSCSEIFTIYVYTAGKKKYADQVLDRIDVNSVIERRFYRDSCKKINGNVVKDLRYLKKVLREKKDMILVDDNVDSIRHNYPFAVKVEAFEGDQQDNHLKSTFQTLLRFYH